MIIFCVEGAGEGGRLALTVMMAKPWGQMGFWGKRLDGR